MEHRRFSISPERYKVVLQEISDGSELAMCFYIMVALSTMIASFGISTNSTAVIIGAMLVSAPDDANFWLRFIPLEPSHQFRWHNWKANCPRKSRPLAQAFS